MPSSRPFGDWPDSLKCHPSLLVPAVVIGVVVGCLFRAHLNLDERVLLSGDLTTSTPLSVARGTAFQAIGAIAAALQLHSSIPAKVTKHSSGHVFLDPSVYKGANHDSCVRKKCWTKRPVRHPIEDLMADAERAWNDKLARQSKTLEEAVTEYRRRYGRNPPKGFDDWYQFAVDNNVQLIDEFDIINRDIEPFLGIRGETVRRRLDLLKEQEWTYVFEFSPGKINVTGHQKGNGRARDQRNMMSAWADWAPETSMAFSSHDGPTYTVSTTADRKYREAARQGRVLDDEEAEDPGREIGLWGFGSACPQDSRFRRFVSRLDELPPGPSFVSDHVATMDLCKNPEWQWMHGTTSWTGPEPSARVPLFSMAKTSMHGDILCVPLEQYYDEEEWDCPWEEKAYAKAGWRGSTTGIAFDRSNQWKMSQRMRMYWKSQDRDAWSLVRFNGKSSATWDVDSVVERNVSVADLVDRYLDFGFYGHAHQCSEDDGTCDAVRKSVKFGPFLAWNEANRRYKYMVDIDGNGWSGRFHRLLVSNAAVLKSTIFPEWYSDWIQPWYHYIPLKVDYTDLFDIMAFFAGDLEGKNAHDELGKRIAMQGKEYARNFWRLEDMQAFTFRLALEWARCTSDDRSSMDYTG